MRTTKAEKKYFEFPIWPPDTAPKNVGVAIYFDLPMVDAGAVEIITKGMLRGVFLATGPLRKKYYEDMYPGSPCRWWGIVPELHRQLLGSCECLACEAEREDYARDPGAAKAFQDALRKQAQAQGDPSENEAEMLLRAALIQPSKENAK